MCHTTRQKRQVIHRVSLQWRKRLDASHGMNGTHWPTGATVLCYVPRCSLSFLELVTDTGEEAHSCAHAQAGKYLVTISINCALYSKGQPKHQECLAQDDYSSEGFWRKWQVNLLDWQEGGGWTKPREGGEGHSGWKELHETGIGFFVYSYG